MLGGNYTVQTDTGLYRLDGKDADAIGENREGPNAVAGRHARRRFARPRGRVGLQLRQVFDPEIPVNIVDLGPRVYTMDISKADDGGHVRWTSP